MSEAFVGCVVSLHCGDILGTYQGHVSMVDKTQQTISLQKAFRNGVKCTVPELTISAIDIKDLKLLKTAEAVVEEEKERERKKKNYSVRTPKKGCSLDSADIKKGKSEIISENNNAAFHNGVSILPKKVSNGTFQQSCSNIKLHGEKSHSYGDKSQNGGKSKKSDFLRRSDTAPSKLSDSYKGCVENGVRQNGSSSSHKLGSSDISCVKMTPKKDDLSNGLVLGDSFELTGGRPQTLKGDESPTQAYVRQRINSVGSSDVRRKPSSPRVIDPRNGHKMKVKDMACFSAPIDDSYLAEFDFEYNLGLFDKAAVFEEINKTTSHDDITLEKLNKKKKNYRFDENILQPDPCALKDIIVPPSTGQHYYKTANGSHIPVIASDLRSRIFSAAEKCGLSCEKRTELVGLAASQVAVANLGGASRLSLENVHQRPTIVVLCGPHLQGAQGVNCARHLANQGVDVIVFLPSFVKMMECLMTEVEIYKLTEGSMISCIKDLSNCTVDLIINALDCQEKSFLSDQQWYKDVTEWANNNKAPVLSLDPPCVQQIETRFTLAVGLPLSITSNVGTVYLCDVGIPKKVFSEFAIQYVSPFCGKFYILLDKV
ncbi:enhancer of mRNA-decapping protein 3-like [Saccoglossus kowalevskii]|uniref:Enhancer of mRNA-decapping protein 3-like n=1 Tax=Saccoglossus kowalevskii TaxID=10224 RepID=A0ABM0MAX8_SACKO|nr:PREDICTED: enhancer of mRNA-decapping protein 3-like [Saccoglossus kowalevskii]